MSFVAPASAIEEVRTRPPSYLRRRDARIAYYTDGEAGAPVLLVMGFGVPGRGWAMQVPVLAAHHRLAWFDNRGAGETAAPPRAYTMQLLAADALALVDHLGWDRFHLVGVSMGGMVAQELALAAQQRLLSLSLIATHPGGVGYRLPPSAGLPVFIRTQVGDDRKRAAALSQLLFSPAFLDTAEPEVIRGILRSDFAEPRPVRYFLAQLAAVLRHDTRRRLAALAAVPTLIIKAGGDILVAPHGSDQLHAAIPGSRLEVLDGCGHGAIRERAEQVNRWLLEHFAAASGSASERVDTPGAQA